MQEKAKEPEIRFAGFTGAWEQRKLGALLDEYKVSIPTPHDGYTRLGIRSHAKGTFHEYVPKGRELETKEMNKVAKDKLILNITFAWEHAVAITDEKDEGALVSHRFPQFTLHPEIIPNFLKYVILDESFRHHLYLASPGGAGRNRVLKISQMLEYAIKYPSTAEQLRISNLLDSINSLITLHQRKYEKLLNIKKSMLEKMFPKEGEVVPEIRFKGFTGAWEQRKLNEIADVYDGVHQTPKYTSSGVRFLSVENIATLESEKYISEADFIRDFKIFPQKGDILMTRIGDIGTAKVIKSDEKYAFYVSLALLKPKHINSDFLCNSIASKNFQKGLKARSLLTAIPLKINKEEIGKVATSFPLNLSEQEKIGSFFNHIESLLTLHQRKLEMLKNVKQAFLEKMFV